jgi:hypothetical protein
MYASLFEPPTAGVTLADLPASHAEGPTLFNVLRVLDLPAAVALTAGHAPLLVELKGDEVNLTAFAKQTAGQLKGGVIQIEVR